MSNKNTKYHKPPRKETIDKTVEALEKEKQMYKKKYEELLQKQQMPQNEQGANMNLYIGPLKNIQGLHPSSRLPFPLSMMQLPSTSGSSKIHIVRTETTDITVGVAENKKEMQQKKCELLAQKQQTPQNPQGSRPSPDYEENDNQLDCVSCKNKLGQEIFQCKNKHNSCRNCKILRAVSCGVCRQNITDIRNYALEIRIAGLNVNPSNQMVKLPVDGCCLYVKQHDMYSHIKESSQFKNIVCPMRILSPSSKVIYQCNWIGKIEELKAHFNKSHPQHCIADVGKGYRLNCKDDGRVLHLVTHESFNFLIHIKVDGRENVIMMTAQLVGTRLSAEKWSYQFHVFNKRTPKRKYQYNAICHSDIISVEDIFGKADCAVMSSAYANSFGDNGILTYKFYLIRNK